MPGIGTCLESDTVWGIVMKGGTVAATGGEGAPGLRANKVQLDGGTLTAVAGSEGVPGVVATTGTITLGTGMEVWRLLGALSKRMPTKAATISSRWIPIRLQKP